MVHRLDRQVAVGLQTKGRQFHPQDERLTDECRRKAAAAADQNLVLLVRVATQAEWKATKAQKTPRTRKATKAQKTPAP